jgi:hypothetical protein
MLRQQLQPACATRARKEEMLRGEMSMCDSLNNVTSVRAAGVRQPLQFPFLPLSPRAHTVRRESSFGVHSHADTDLKPRSRPPSRPACIQHFRVSPLTSLEPLEPLDRRATLDSTTRSLGHRSEVVSVKQTARCTLPGTAQPRNGALNHSRPTPASPSRTPLPDFL